MHVGNAVTLRKNWEFKRAYRRGKSFAHPGLVCYCFSGKGRHNRVGVTAAKKVGCAVRRNRARRVIKEAYRSICSQVKTGCDIVFVAREATLGYKSTELAPVMLALLKKAGAVG